VKSIHVRTAASVVIALVMALLAAAAQAQTYSVLYKFHGKPDGAFPSAVIQDAMGNFYGTTSVGGVSNLGTVFKLSKTGESVLYSFCLGGPPCTDGINPTGGLIQDASGNLYGTAAGGGTGCGSNGCGVVFNLDTNGKETVLYNFAGGTDGSGPTGGLIQDANGNFYGTTFVGGGSGCHNGQGCGTVFKLDPNGKETVLHSFGGNPDGQYPITGVIQDANGNLYGTTFYGGVYNKGTVFRLTATGVEAVLRSFKARTDGKGPDRLIQDAKGNLYGTASEGGSAKCGGAGCGVVFRLDLTGKESVLNRFLNTKDGNGPRGGVLRDSKGNLYGTAVGGGTGCGSNGCGVVFKLDVNRKETVLHRFTGGAGAHPETGVIRDAQGNLYGTTLNGGDLSCGQGQGCGVVFKLTP
jgi:uncharacterized repeat protein (TIGR03803 family)